MRNVAKPLFLFTLLGVATLGVLWQVRQIDPASEGRQDTAPPIVESHTDEADSGKLTSDHARQNYTEIEDARAVPVIADFTTPLSKESQKWLDEYVYAPYAVKFDRYRFARIDLVQLLQAIQSSPQYLSAASGIRYEGESTPDFLFQPFEDKTYRLVFRRANVQDDENGKITAISGISYDENENSGRWSLVINESDGHVLGTIDAHDDWIKIWPAPTQSFHVIAELSQENRAVQMKEKSNW